MPKGLEATNIAQGITNQIMTLTMDMSERIIDLEQINSRAEKENARLTELLESQYKIESNLCEVVKMLQEQLLEKES